MANYNSILWPVLSPGPTTVVHGINSMFVPAPAPNLTPSSTIVVKGLYPLVVPPADNTAHNPVIAAPYLTAVAAPPGPNATTYKDPNTTAQETRTLFNIVQTLYPPVPNYP
jgi:hypothetical protein